MKRLQLCSGALGMVALLSMVAILVRSPRCASAEDGTIAHSEQKIAELKMQIASLRAKCEWLERLRRHDPARSAASEVVRVRFTADGSAVPGDDEYQKQLRTIRLGDVRSKEDVREYVARILARSEARSDFDVSDPEIDMLKRVGAANVDVLLEPLVSIDDIDSLYLTEAIGALVVESQKPLILGSLGAAPILVDLIVARGWTRDAAPILLKHLEARSRALTAEWVAAAASVAGPKDYAALQFQLAHGQNPWWAWVAIRDLPDMEPLDAFIDAEWRGKDRAEGTWEWDTFAAVAAHYGHMDALDVLARRAATSGTFLSAFRSLTEYDDVPKQASAWLAKNRARLVFDRAKRVYVRSSGGR